MARVGSRAPLEVHGQLGRRLDGPLTEAGLDALANPGMQFHAACCRHALVDDLLIERMAKTVMPGHGPVGPRVGAVRRQERGAPGQLGAAALHVVEADLLGGRHGGSGELHASGARRLEDPALVGTHAVEVVPDHPANVFGIFGDRVPSPSS